MENSNTENLFEQKQRDKEKPEDSNEEHLGGKEEAQSGKIKIRRGQG